MEKTAGEHVESFIVTKRRNMQIIHPSLSGFAGVCSLFFLVTSLQTSFPDMDLSDHY